MLSFCPVQEAVSKPAPKLLCTSSPQTFSVSCWMTSCGLSALLLGHISFLTGSSVVLDLKKQVLYQFTFIFFLSVCYPSPQLPSPPAVAVVGGRPNPLPGI